MSLLPCLTIALLVGLAASTPDYGFEEVPNTISNGYQPQPFSDIMHPSKVLRSSKQKRITIKAWPKGIIAYRIDQSFNGDTEMNNLILAAMREIEDNTKRPDGSYCVRFIKKRPSDYDHILIANINGCVSPLGNAGRSNSIVTLGGPFCRSRTLIIHELMHTLGFTHEQNRPDRDNYVTVDWSNILRGQENNFKAYDYADVDTRSTRYDFGSIMHYTPFHWAADRSKPNLSMRDSRQLPEGVRLGGTKYMSKTDTMRVQQFYGCPVDTSHIKQEDMSARLGACNFEHDMCGLIQARNDDFDWKRVRGATRTQGTGPGGDHSAGSGYYLLGEAQGHYNKVAKLKTRQFQDGGKFCLTVYINTYGRGGELTIILRELASRIEHKDRHVSASNNPFWKSVQLTVTMPPKWELEFVYKAGPGADSNIAIDDFHLSKGKCD